MTTNVITMMAPRMITTANTRVIRLNTKVYYQDAYQGLLVERILGRITWMTTKMTTIVITRRIKKY